MSLNANIWVCFIAILCNIIPIYFIAAEDNNIIKIYNSNKLSDDQKYDSILIHYFTSEKPIKQLVNANTLIEISNKNSDFRWLYRAYYFKANAYFYIAELDKACSTYILSLKAAELGKIEEGIGDIYLGLGNAFSIGGNNEQAIKYYSKALLKYQELSDTLYISYTLLNLIDEFHKINQFDSISYYLAYSDSIFKYATGTTNLVAYAYGYKAILKAKTNNIAASLSDIEKAKVLLARQGRLYDIVAFQIEMARVLQKQNKPELALKYTLDCFIKAKETNLNEQVRDASKLLSELYNELGDYKQAYKFQSE